MPSKLEIAERLYQAGKELSTGAKAPDTVDDLPVAAQSRFLRYGEEVVKILEESGSATPAAPAKMALVNLPMWSKTAGRAKVEELVHEDFPPAAIAQCDVLIVLWPDNSFSLLKGAAKVKVANSTAANALIDALANDLAFKLLNPSMFSESVRTTFEMYETHVGKENVPPEVKKASEI